MKSMNVSRVWRVTKKPTSKEFWLVAKIVAMGFLIIGLIGLIMEFVWQIIFKPIF